MENPCGNTSVFGTNDMLCVILVGGKGSRLKKIVKDNLPKPLAPIEGKPFLCYQIVLLRKKGFRKFLLCTGIMASKIEEKIQDGSSFGVEIAYSKERRPLGTGGAIKNAEAYLNKTFLLLNGDTYLDIDYNSFLKYHVKKSSKLSIVVTKHGHKHSYGMIKMDLNKRIVAFSEKELIAESYVNAGAYIIDPEVLDFILKNQFVSLERDTIPRCIKNKMESYGYVFKGNFYDIGTPEGYRAFKNFIKRRRSYDIPSTGTFSY